MSITLEEFRARFKRSSSGTHYICPCHDDTRGSLSINPGEKVAFVFRCHAGCRSEDILKAVDVSLGKEKPRHEVARWVYRDISGRAIVSVVKYHPKTFIRVPKGVQSEHIPPYNYNLLNATTCRRVFICEGEKDADVCTHTSSGCVGTTNISGGNSLWHPKWDKVMEGKKVYACEDNDYTGYERTIAIFQRFQEVKLAVFRDKRKGYDVSDFIRDGGRVSQIVGKSGLEPRLREYLRLRLLVLPDV